jgi:predicted nucleotidyltransferase
MKLRDQLRQQSTSIRAAAATFGGDNVRLFGSVARDEHTADSDLDVLIRLAPGRTLLDLARIEIALERLLGRRVDVVTEAGLREPLRTTVLREAIPV